MMIFKVIFYFYGNIFMYFKMEYINIKLFILIDVPDMILEN